MGSQERKKLHYIRIEIGHVSGKELERPKVICFFILQEYHSCYLNESDQRDQKNSNGNKNFYGKKGESGEEFFYPCSYGRNHNDVLTAVKL